MHTLFKAPGGPFSFYYQLLSIHYAHFLKAAPLGQGQMDILLLPKGGESQSQGPNKVGSRSSRAQPSITQLSINMKGSLSQTQTHLPLTTLAWTHFNCFPTKWEDYIPHARI